MSLIIIKFVYYLIYINVIGNPSYSWNSCRWSIFLTSALGSSSCLTPVPSQVQYAQSYSMNNPISGG